MRRAKKERLERERELEEKKQEMLRETKRQESKIKVFNALSWVIFAFGIIFSIFFVCEKSIASFILMLAFSAAIMPIKPIQNLWSKIPKYKVWMKATVLCFVFILAIGVSTTKPNIDSTDVIKELDTFTSVENTSVEETTEEETTEEDTAIVPDRAGSEEAQTPKNPSSVSAGSIAAYSKTAYTTVNNNQPNFTSEQKRITKSFENYSSLDSLGRCGVALACLSKTTMPAEGEERKSISDIKPTGWQQAQYDFVSGKYLYNRCHLIGWQLSAENANKQNLITGTRYLNTEGMLPYENMVADYIKETNNHVMYRVTPVFDGNNLLALGVQIEAWSVEDAGSGICFNIYCYNVQSGVSINYATGASTADGSIATTVATTKASTTKTPTTKVSTTSFPICDCRYVLNTNSKKFHKPSCASAKKISDANRQEYNGSRDDLLSQGYEPCKNCNP